MKTWGWDELPQAYVMIKRKDARRVRPIVPFVGCASRPRARLRLAGAALMHLLRRDEGADCFRVEDGLARVRDVERSCVFTRLSSGLAMSPSASQSWTTGGSRHGCKKIPGLSLASTKSRHVKSQAAWKSKQIRVGKYIVSRENIFIFIKMARG